MKIEREGNKMKIEIELDKDPPLSSTGRSRLLFSTGGFVTIDENGTKMNLVVTAPIRRIGR